MGKVRYLGSKARLVQEIINRVGFSSEGRFIDLFCGTGSISLAAGLNNWKVSANDTLLAAATLTSAKLISLSEAKFVKLGGYQSVLNDLNNVDQEEGFFYREYSSSAENKEMIERPYFSIQNSKKIDAIRSKIRSWSQENLIDKHERTVLLADLIESANEVANIAGTYGCFLKKLSKNALSPLLLKPRDLLLKKIDWAISQEDALNVNMEIEDTVYIDPPYTKRQYAAYYHIPETIANDDEPDVSGITGLRPWHSKASDFCYKTRASGALDNLIKIIPSKRVFISYSSEGHINQQDLMKIANSYGKTSITYFENFGRYISNKASSNHAKKNPLTEFLIEINR